MKNHKIIIRYNNAQTAIFVYSRFDGHTQGYVKFAVTQYHLAWRLAQHIQALCGGIIIDSICKDKHEL